MKTDTNTDKSSWIREQVILFEDVIFPQKDEGRA